MTDKEFIEQIDELWAEAKQKIYRRAGQLVGSGGIDLREVGPMDYSVAKAVILSAVPGCFGASNKEQKALARRFQRAPTGRRRVGERKVER